MRTRTFEHGKRAGLRLLSGLVLCLGLPAAGLGQESTLVEALSGKTHPLSRPLKSFTGEWRRVTIPGPAAASGNAFVNVSGNSTAATSQNNINGALTETRAYLTQGQTIAAGGRVYLVAYRLPGTGLDLTMLLQALTTKQPVATVTLTPESAVPLSLLDLASLSALDDIRAADLASEIAESERAARIVSELFKGQAGSAASAPPPKKTEESK